MIFKNNDKINKKLLQHIKKNLPQTENKLQLAIALYFCTGKIFEYNLEYNTTAFDEKFNNVKNISLENNKVICIQWAKIFCQLLKTFGIEAEITTFSAKHKAVTIYIDRIEYIADLTQSRYENGKHHLSDSTNIKYNFEIENFRISTDQLAALEYFPETDTEQLIANLNKEIIYIRTFYSSKFINDARITEIKNKIQRKVEKHKKSNPLKVNIDYRIKILNILNNFNYAKGEAEHQQFLIKITNEMFSDLEWHEFSYTTLYNIEGEIKTYLLITILIEDEVIHYLETEKGFIKIPNDELFKELIKRDCKIRKFEKIDGIKEEDLNKLKLVK